MDQGAVAEEVELKFLGPEAALEQLRRVPSLRKFARGRRFQTKSLRTVYFDTADFALRDQGLILRVREEDGVSFKPSSPRATPISPRATN